MALALLFAAPAVRGQTGDSSPFIRGDANADGDQDIGDALGLFFCTFLGSSCSDCADAADVDDDGLRNVLDPIYILAFLFLEGPQPPAPSSSCGVDTTEDELDCRTFPPCLGPDSIWTSRGELRVIPIEHASLAILWDGKTILADPVGGAARYRNFQAPDLVVITHIHGDHMDAATLRGIASVNTVLVVPASVAARLAGTGVLEIVDERVLANGARTMAGDIEVEAVPMYNLTAERLRYHARGDGNSYVIDLAGTRIYVSGDTEDIPEMRALADIDLAFICMNLPFTMTPAQAASAALEFQPRVVYPYHYSGQDPQVFKSLVEAGSPDIDVRLRNWYP